MKLVVWFVFLALSGISCAEEGASLAAEPDFEAYRVAPYQGKIMLPGQFKKDDAGLWRDAFGKGMDVPRINFAGRYFLSLHSCGAECRYYQLTDLASGRTVPGLEMFASGDPPNVTREGHRYMTILDYRADSRMLIAYYQIEKDAPGEYDCRERVFLFDETEQIKPISRTKYRCGK